MAGGEKRKMSWKDKLHPSVSKAEIEVFKELSRLRLTKGMVIQKSIILRQTIPDFLWLNKRKVVYLDGDIVHKKQVEKDEETTRLLEVKGVNVLRISYPAPLSDK